MKLRTGTMDIAAMHFPCYPPPDVLSHPPMNATFAPFMFYLRPPTMLPPPLVMLPTASSCSFFPNPTLHWRRPVVAVAVGESTDALTVGWEAAVRMEKAKTDAAAVCAPRISTNEAASVDNLNADNGALSSDQPSRSHRPHARRGFQPTRRQRR